MQSGCRPAPTCPWSVWVLDSIGDLFFAVVFVLHAMSANANKNMLNALAHSGLPCHHARHTDGLSKSTPMSPKLALDVQATLQLSPDIAIRRPKIGIGDNSVVRIVFCMSCGG